MEYELRKNVIKIDYEQRISSEKNSEKLELGRKIASSYNSTQIKQFCKKYFVYYTNQVAKKILQFFQTPIFSNFQSRHNVLTEELDEIKMDLFALKEESKIINECDF